MPGPLLAHTGLAILGSIVFVASFAGLLTWVVSILLLRRYRARVGRLMSAAASQPPPQQETAAIAGAMRRSDAGDPQPSAGDDWCGEALYRATREGPRRAARRYAAAGAVYALLVATAAWFAFSQTQVNYLRAASHPLQLVLLAWILAWPAILTLNAVGLYSRARRWITILVYLGGLVAIGLVLSLIPTEAAFRLGDVTLPGWSGESPARVAAKWCLFNAAPTALILAFGGLRLRAVAPLVLAFMAVLGTGLLAILAAALGAQEMSVRASAAVAALLGIGAAAAFALYFVALALAACLAFALPGWLLLRRIRRAHERKAASDQSIEVGAHWLLFAAFHAAILAYGGPGWALAPFAGLAAFRFAYRLSGTAVPGGRGPTLLVLRVFSLGRQSERLFEALTPRWRHAGSVTLIAGTDLAASTVAPRQFLAFVSGRLHRLFVRTRADIDAALASVDHARDADGRFRVNDFFCTPDTWQPVLMRLVCHADVVLMDLRRFGATNAGCVFEIEALLRTVPASRLVFVVDATTDTETFDSLARRCCAQLPAGAANARLSTHALQRFALKSLRQREVQRLLRTLCGAAAVDAVNARVDTRAA